MEQITMEYEVNYDYFFKKFYDPKKFTRINNTVTHTSEMQRVNATYETYTKDGTRHVFYLHSYQEKNKVIRSRNKQVKLMTPENFNKFLNRAFLITGINSIGMFITNPAIQGLFQEVAVNGEYAPDPTIGEYCLFAVPIVIGLVKILLNDVSKDME